MMGRALTASAALLLLAGCDKILTDRPKEKIAAAQAKAKAGEHRDAVELYEDALDGTSTTAEVHYRLAVIYDEKLKRPASALHHFQRYIDLAPKGTFADEARAWVKDGQRKLAGGLGGGGPATQTELIRFKNENLSLQRQLIEAKQRIAALSVTAAKRAEETKAPLPPGARRHTVQTGDTPSSISQKYYGTRSHAQDILDANHNQLAGKKVIKPGQILIIP
ncbi:MAG: LysM peptidoglycan-binding domain-containing protein [Chthoniobacteraceae bacterium]